MYFYGPPFRGEWLFYNNSTGTSSMAIFTVILSFTFSPTVVMRQPKQAPYDVVYLSNYSGFNYMKCMPPYPCFDGGNSFKW